MPIHYIVQNKRCNISNRNRLLYKIALSFKNIFANIRRISKKFKEIVQIYKFYINVI